MRVNTKFLEGVAKDLKAMYVIIHLLLSTEPVLTLSLTNSYICLAPCQKKFAHFSSLSIFCLGCKMISLRAARRLIALHRKQNIESELKQQTF